MMIAAFKKTGETSIEKSIKNILAKENIKFEKSFYVYFKDRSKYKIYDFYLFDYNLLIEADGDYWHANPNKFTTLNETQSKNVKNDKFKNNLAKEKGYNLVRFWEEDIKKKDFEETLLETLRKHGKKD